MYFNNQRFGLTGRGQFKHLLSEYERHVFLPQVLIKQIDSSDNIHTISSAISNLLSLTQDGPQLCSIIAKVMRSYGCGPVATWSFRWRFVLNLSEMNLNHSSI